MPIYREQGRQKGRENQLRKDTFLVLNVCRTKNIRSLRSGERLFVEEGMNCMRCLRRAREAREMSHEKE